MEYFNNGPIYKNEVIGLDMPLFNMIYKIEIVKHMFLNLLTMKELLNTFWILKYCQVPNSKVKKSL